MAFIYDVLIIGAGPCGLATAIGLRERGITNIAVLDQAREFQHKGQQINIMSNGLRALNYLSPATYKKLRHVNNVPVNPPASPTSNRVPQWVTRNCDGKALRAVPTEFHAFAQKFGEGSIGMRWYELQKQLREQLPQQTVRTLHRCVNVAQDEANALVRVECDTSRRESPLSGNEFAHWIARKSFSRGNEHEHKLEESSLQKTLLQSFSARIVIGADGIKSAVRKSILSKGPYAPFATPEYGGFVGIGCTMTNKMPDKIYAKLEERYFKGNRVVVICNDSAHIPNEARLLRGVNINGIPHIILLKVGERQFLYLVQSPLALSDIEGKSGTALVELAVAVLREAGFPEDVLRIVKESQPGETFCNAYHIHRTNVSDWVPLPGTAEATRTVHDSAHVEPVWSSGRVALAGDAAHGMPPFSSQGVGQCFEDAALLSQLIADASKEHGLKNSTAISNAFKMYEEIRRPRMSRLQRDTMSFALSGSEEQQEEYHDRIYRHKFHEAYKFPTNG